MRVEHVLSKDFLPGFCSGPLVHRIVYVPPHVNVARMHAYLAVTKVHCIATAMVLLLVACLRLVRLPAMHEERPSNAKIAGEINFSIRILFRRDGREVSLAGDFAHAAVVCSALYSAFCTACTRVFAHTAGLLQLHAAGGYIMAAVVQ